MGIRARPIADRFWDKVRKGRGCWEWTSTKRLDGYGVMSQPVHVGTMLRAHRVSWELHNGPIPDGLCVLHKCDNPGCVNPRHLFLGTRADNLRDAERKGRWPGRRNVKGERNPFARLTDTQVLTIKQKLTRGVSMGDLAARYGVTYNAIENIKAGRSWRHV